MSEAEITPEIEKKLENTEIYLVRIGIETYHLEGFPKVNLKNRLGKKVFVGFYVNDPTGLDDAIAEMGPEIRKRIAEAVEAGPGWKPTK